MVLPLRQDALRGSAVTRPLNAGQVKMASLMAEAVLQEHVRATCERLGVKHMHPWSSKRTEPGWPDSFMVGPAGILVRELKREDPRKGKVTDAQREWLDAMRDQGLNVGVWRPSDWYAETIQDEILRISGRRKAS